ncbi:MAG TPA: Na+/H+ antiporter [Candidatus Limnocylindrales bacterium]|nr:Na+/H+ antiporter [Candidatus Limnocylindrales bacterium]
MRNIEVVLGLLVLATVLAGVARRLRLPEPIVLVVAGLAVGLLPGAPAFELDPSLVFLFFLPPILYGAGYFTSIRDFKANLRPILLLSVGLVIFTTVIVAAVVKYFVPDLPWAAAFAFGAIVSPPDAVAATSVFRRLGVPRRLVTILEGESLVNDATALVLLRTSVLAVGGTFSAVNTGGDFVIVAVGGILVGLVVARIAGIFMTRIQDADLGIVFSLLVPAIAYIPAEYLHVSGVLSVVVAGIYAGRIAARSLSSEQRVEGAAAWKVVIFLINGLVFIVIGLQLPVVLADLDGTAPQLLGLATVIGLTVIAARFVWVFPATYLPRALSARIRERDPYPGWRYVVIVSWAGMRGVVSLAAALALPVDFPERSLLQFLTFTVIIATLVLQGVTLPLVIRALGITAGDAALEEERNARLAAGQAAVDRIDQLEREHPGHKELIDHLRETYVHRVEHVDISDGTPRGEAEQELLEHRQIRRKVIDAEREAVIAMRDRGELSDDVMRRLERDLDLEELREEA